MATADPPGTILLSHPVHVEIGAQPMLDALPAHARQGDRQPCEIAPLRIPLVEAEELDLHEAQRAQEREYRERLLPLLERHPDHVLAYFGVAPVPLAMHLGYLVGSTRRLAPFQLHHGRKDWRWEGRSEEDPPLGLQVRGTPVETVRGGGDVIVRLSISHAIDPQDTLAVVPGPLAEIDIALAEPDDDALRSPDDLEAVAAAFKAALDDIAAHRPGADTVHVFAAIPGGLAFRLGACVSPTIHAKVQTYQFQKRQSPRYQPAFLLQPLSPPAPTPSVAERERADRLRTWWGEELLHLARFARRCQAERDKAGHPEWTWIEHLVDDHEWVRCFARPWHGLPFLFETPILDSTVAAASESQDGAGRFYDRATRRWRVDDTLLLRFLERFPDEAAARRAGRLLFLHEAVHQKAHRLTGATYRRIGRYPKILEEVDYQADVWALLHEFSLAQRTLASPAQVHRAFQGLIEDVLQSLWAFDAGPGPMSAIEVRRLNRYLIWYWQQMRVEGCRTLQEALAVLAYRPLIELSGPRIRQQDDEVLYVLDPGTARSLEICVLDDNRIDRRGGSDAIALGELLAGFRARQGERVREALRSVFDQVDG